MRKKNPFILTAASACFIFLFFQLPANKVWLKKKIFHYWDEYQVQKNNLDPEARMEASFGSTYTASKAISSFFEYRGIQNKVLVLIPPTAYFQSMGNNFTVPEPAVFYYFTGLKTISVESKDAENANWIVRSQKDLLIFDSVANHQVLLDSITAFKKFMKAP